jgi:hypothetical protein
MRTFCSGQLERGFHLVQRALEISRSNRPHDHLAFVADDIRRAGLIRALQPPQRAATFRIPNRNSSDCMLVSRRSSEWLRYSKCTASSAARRGRFHPTMRRSGRRFAVRLLLFMLQLALAFSAAALAIPMLCVIERRGDRAGHASAGGAIVRTPVRLEGHP